MFVHLRVHSDFSVVDGTARIDPLVQAAAADGQPALALTDLNNMFGAIKFYGAARRAGLKPILGVEVMLTGLPGQSERAAAAAHGHSQQPAPKVLLLAQNATGYHHLCLLLSAMWTTHQGRDQPVLDWSDLCAHHEGLVLLSGAQAGPIGAALLAGDEDKASEWATCMAQVFAHRFYLEVQRAGRSQDEAHVQAAARLAARLGLPLVATHPVQFVHADDYDSHEARVCIAEGDMLGNRRRVRRFTREQHLLSAQEMQARFADLPSAVANAVHLAARCSLTLTLGQPQLPRFPTPLRDGQPLPVGQHLREVAFEGLTQRLQQLYPDAATRQAKQAAYEERLAFEIDTIDAMGFAGYFLIVGDFVNWARGHGCPVGPGRGSGAGSLVAYALRITDLDPLRYNLLFERFLNPERVSMPDFDIDFCQANRDRVIEYVKNRYGRDAVSQIATFGTMAARAAVRDVGRVLDMSYTFCDGVAKLIPNKPGQHITIADALRDEPALAERASSEEEVGELLRMAQKLEGVTRNVGMHAGGVLIAPGKLTDFCPLYQQPGSQSAVSQFDKDDVEAAGLVKFDFLGLATLTILQIATDFLRASHPSMADFSFDNVPLDDAKVYALFGRGQTEAVFQFESRGMQGMLRDAKPQRLEDLIALNALFRPGPMELIPTYIARKHGRETVVYPHPSLEPILSETFGIMVYQEQVMQVAQVMAGYSLGGADMLRRAMGKKKPEEMAKQRDIFLRGAEQKDIDAKVAGEVFDLMESFAGYGFNKSHAAAYSLLAYHTAWLKV
ncbi:MAG: DNA polymerase III subunit alpha, partial [Burkholderiaceae bacterium]